VFVIALINHYISFVAMREAGISQVLTFDRHFVQAGFEVLASGVRA
jgi:predicted nucleic acid-binding protein